MEHGLVVGVFAHNGGGKSVLFKILYRVTKPTGGHAEVHGKVDSRLEFGTGFQPELTGKENINPRGVFFEMKLLKFMVKLIGLNLFSKVGNF